MVIGEKYRRKNPSLYGARFKKRLLDEVVWFRSEKLPNYSEFYVDNDHITRIDNNGDHLISGRRGTEKTHLLGVFHELIQSRSNEVSVFVSLTDIGYQSHEYFESQDTNSKNRRVARQVFSAFLHDFFDKLLDSVSEALKHRDAEQKQRVNDTLQALLAEIVLGSPVSIRSAGVETSENTDASETQKKAGAGLAAKLDSIGLNLGASIGRESLSKENTTGRTEVESIYVTDPRRVRKLLVQVADQCGLETIHILIDEWMELDKKSASRIQSHFAQLLKMTFFNEPKISVKIASIWSQTEVYERKGMDVSQGLQVGQDIQHTIDLDSSFLTSEAEIISFVKNLLYKRLRRKVPDLRRFEVVEGDVDDEIITELFDDMKNFKVFVTAGHGIPRDLMRIFEKSFQRIRADFEEYAVNYELIIDVSRDIYSANKRDVIAPGSPTKQQWIYINNYMELTGRRFFIVESDAPQKSTALRNLIDHELIHEVHAPVLPRMIRRNHRLYMIDYGTFVDWKKASFAPTEEMLSEFIFPNIDTSNFDLEGCKVDVVSDAEIYMDCNSCGKSVERSSPVVVKHQLCPLCGDSVT